MSRWRCTILSNLPISPRNTFFASQATKNFNSCDHTSSLCLACTTHRSHSFSTKNLWPHQQLKHHQEFVLHHLTHPPPYNTWKIMTMMYMQLDKPYCLQMHQNQMNNWIKIAEEEIKPFVSQNKKEKSLFNLHFR